MFKWLRKLFRPTIVNNYYDQVPAYSMQQCNGFLYVITKNGKLYRVNIHEPMWPVCEHILTFNNY